MKYWGISGWLVVLILVVGGMDYRSELEIENVRLKAKVARMVEPPSLVSPLRCTWIAQRIDTRNKQGEIVKSKWRRRPVCAQV